MIALARQDAIVQSQIATLNQSYVGEIAVGDVHLAPFKNFPYIDQFISIPIQYINKSREFCHRRSWFELL